MRVLELWSVNPMRLGPGGNTMPTHLVEVVEDAASTEQPWCVTPAKHPPKCVSMRMDVDPIGVLVEVAQADGSCERYLIPITNVSTMRVQGVVAAAPAKPSKAKAAKS